MKVKALRAHSYAGDNYVRGEEYEVQPKHLKVLVAAKAVEEVQDNVFSEESSSPVSQSEERNEEVASESKPVKRKRGRPRKGYSRMDLRAEGSGPFESSAGKE